MLVSFSHVRIRKISDRPCLAITLGLGHINNKDSSFWSYRWVFKTVPAARGHPFPHDTVWMWTWAAVWSRFLPDGKPSRGETGRASVVVSDTSQRGLGRERGKKTHTKWEVGGQKGTQFYKLAIVCTYLQCSQGHRLWNNSFRKDFF